VLVITGFALLIWAGLEAAVRFQFGTPIPVPAKVLSAEVTEVKYTTASNRQHHTELQLVVRYSYSSPHGSGVSSRWATNATYFNASGGFDGVHVAEREKAKWPVGLAFTAYQSSTDPNYVVIVNPATDRNLYVALALFGLAIAAAATPIMIKRRRS
jgi:hypothetical protein